MNKKKLVSAMALIIIAIIIWNYPLAYRIGISGVVVEKKIPLYAKVCGFLYRDWMYRDIVKGIIGGEKDPLKRTLAILNWVNKNVTCGIPKGLHIVDDHPLNIIIRQFGAGDQVQDIFTILCSYAGTPAGMAKCYNKDRSSFKIFSLVCVKGRWLIFDAIAGKYFLNKNGAFASIEDYLKGEMVLSERDKEYYKEFLDYLKNIDFSTFTRADEQMPLRRIPAGIKKMFFKEEQN